MMEEWRDIPGCEGCYQVSSAGRVRSLDREVQYGGSRPHVRFLKGKILAPRLDKISGHVSVFVAPHGSRKIHQLVLLAFHGPCPPGEESLHKNHTPADNRTTNLKYGTRRENILMDHEAGTRHQVAVKGASLVDDNIVEFPSMAVAALEVAGKRRARTSISKCVHGKIKSAYGYRWSLA